MYRLALVTLLASSVALADKKLPDSERVELPDLVGKIATYGGKVVRIPGGLDAKLSTSYGCGFTKAKYQAVDIEDRGKHIIVYCLRTHETLACAATFKAPAKIQYALVRMPEKCKDARAELLDY